ncbi:MFS transporter [Alteraurantiacibacter aquimixticola]|uniref:MFS transporter n=1 Tax=Alteraurantiacibacter aquimixticola TaxID=2489173 RepID=A0A4T3F4U0_9SPHN|nr:MFS transporter [Alteraurantiacibacter aquimixticola]TIX51479.1 MFS transporter [Alteraurantiacibacter aquimixticola]
MSADTRTIDIAEVIEVRKLSAFNFTLIAVSWLITVFDGFDMMMIGFTAPYMRETLALDELMLGNVFSAGLLGMMLGGFAFAYLGDRFGRRKAIIWSAFAFGILTFATGFATSYEMLMALRFLDGFAIGGMLPLIWALNIEFVPKRMRSTVVTVIMMGYSIGAALAGPVTVWLAPEHGWPAVYFFGGACTLAITLVLVFTLPESIRFLAAKAIRPEVTAATLNRLEPGLEASADNRFILGDEERDTTHFHVAKLFKGDLKLLTPLLWLGYTASTMAVYFTSNWGPIVFEDLDFSRDTAAYVGSITSVFGAGLGLLLMQFTDRKGPFSVAVYPMIALPLLLVTGLAAMGQDAFLILSVVAISLVSGAHFGILSIAGVYYPSAIRANGGGWATSVAKVGGIAGPIVGGYILASGLPVVRSFAILAACPAILVLCAIGIGVIVRRRDTGQPAQTQEPVLST